MSQDDLDDLISITKQRVNQYDKAPAPSVPNDLYDSDDQGVGIARPGGYGGRRRLKDDESFGDFEEPSFQESSEKQQESDNEAEDGQVEEEEEEEEQEEDGFDVDAPARKKNGYMQDEASEDEEFDDDAEDFEALHGDDDDEQGKAIGKLSVVTRSGKNMGNYVPKRPMDLDEVYKELVAEKRPQLKDEVDTINEPKRGVKRKRDDTTDDDDEAGGIENTSKYLERLLKTHNIDMTDDIQTALKNVQENPDEMEEDQPLALAVAGHGAKVARTHESGGDSTDDMGTDQIDEYIKDKYHHDIRNAGVTYERFMKITCPLCAFGNMNGDAIYAPKLQLIRRLANNGAMRGHLETTTMLVCFCWNKYIMKPMIRRGRKILRLTYDMAWEHISEPHIPNPAIAMRFDIRKLSRMADIGSNQIYRRNTVTGGIESDEKIFNATIRAIGTKYSIGKNRLESQAFFDANEDMGDEYAATFTNPYMQVHFGAKEPPHMTNRKANAAHIASEKQNKSRWVRIGRK